MTTKLKLTKAQEQLRDMRPGDVFRWHYRDGVVNSYWCKASIAVVTPRGSLIDIYWMFDIATDTRGDSFTINERNIGDIDLIFLANLTDLDAMPSYQSDYYADADIVDLRHSNCTNRNFYVRKGAKRSADKMMEVARYKIEKNKSDVRSSQWQIEKLKASVEAIEAGKLDEVWL